MNFHVLTLFPEMIEQGMHTSIIGRAIAGGYLSIDAINIRDYAFNKHQKVDDYPYGGGAGMLMQAEPVYLAYKDIEERIQKRIQNAKMQNAETEEQDAEVKVQNAGIQDDPDNEGRDSPYRTADAARGQVARDDTRLCAAGRAGPRQL